MKEIWIIAVLFIIFFLLYTWALGSALKDTGKAVQSQGGIGAVVGKQVHEFNKAVEGK